MVDVKSRSWQGDRGMLYLGALHSITFIKSRDGRRLRVPRRRCRSKKCRRLFYDFFRKLPLDYQKNNVNNVRMLCVLFYPTK